MKNFTEKAKLILGDQMLVRKILYVLGGLLAFRLLAIIPIPGVNASQLASFFNNNQFFGLLNIFSGSGLSTLSVVMLGVGPFITASIIMQVLTMIVPKLKKLYQEEGDAGRIIFTQYSRRLSVALAFLQAYGFLILLEKQGLIGALTGLQTVTSLFVITAGSVLLMWIGELITEYGIGNGLSIIIFAGIIARLPQSLSQLSLIVQSDPTKLPMYAAFAVLALVVVWAVVVVTEAERAIPVTYAKRVRGNKVYGGASTYLPLRVNQAGVIPIIFGLSILLFPQLVLNFGLLSKSAAIHAWSQIGIKLLSNGWFYATAYFLLVFVFTYFYTAVTFDPQLISENLQKSGAFIPGVRPGQSTAEHLGKVVTRITFVGAVFLALIAILPLLIQYATGNTAFAVGGTALLIVVSVVIDLVKKIEGQISMREY